MFIVEAGTLDDFEVPCPFGQELVNGGYALFGPDLRVTAAYPTIDQFSQQGWKVSISSDSDVDRAVRIYAICAETS